MASPTARRWPGLPSRGPASSSLRLLLSAALACSAVGQIRLQSPQSLVQRFSSTQGRIEGSTATFGAPFYGQRLLGRVVYGVSGGFMHCNDTDYTVPMPDKSTVQNSESQEVKPITIVVVKRGMCSFVKKVKVAQDKGAHAVIIVDKDDSALTAQEIRRIIVADDGYGNQVDIPSILISKEEGNALITAVQSTDNVIVELAWDVPTDHVVRVDMWMSSASQDSLMFLREWAPSRIALNDAIKFVPHYYIFGMEQTKDFNDLCSDESAKYCAEDPDGSGPITGTSVLDEDVRQLCIHELYKVTRSDNEVVGRSEHKVEYSREYWDYVSKLLDACPLDGQSPERQFGQKCSEALMNQVGIAIDRVQECVRNTRAEKLKKQREEVAWSPRAIRINGWRYSGSLDSDLVTRAICAGFIHQPKACEKLTEPVPSTLRGIMEPSGGVGLGSFVTSLIVVACVAMAALMFYKRSLTRHIHSALREEVMLEVQQQMDSYKMLS